MAKEKICGIYCIENLINGKKYIGQSTDIDLRFWGHKNSLNKNRHSNKKLQHDWNEYGDKNFKFYVITKCEIGSLDKLEVYYISLYNSHKCDFGYNIELGGYKNKSLSEQSIEIMRSVQHTKPIYQIDLNGNIVNKWSGAREASKKLNVNQSNIWSCLHHKKLTMYGFIWIFEDEYKLFNLSDYINKNTQSRTIVQKTEGGDVIKIWESANETQKIGFDSSAVIKCCKGKYKHHKGFYWSYA